MKAKLQKDSEFRQRMKLVEEQYRTSLQRAFYSDLSAINPGILQMCGSDVNDHPIYVFYGILQPNTDKLLDKLYLHMIQWFQKQFELHKAQKGFLILYFNTFCEGSTRYDDFRNMLRTLPPKYILNLRLVIVHPNFRVKTVDWIVFGTVNNQLKSRTHHCDSILKLDKYGVTVDKTFVEGLREDVRDVDIPKKPTKNNPRIFRQNITSHSKANIETYQEPSTAITNTNSANGKKKLKQYELSEIGVPLVLKTLVMWMRTNPDFLVEEGLFRKSPAIDQEQEAMQHLKRQDYDHIQSIHDPHLTATLIKKFMMNLAQPLIPNIHYKKLATMNCQNAGMFEQLKKLFKQIPNQNYTTIMFTLRFFVREVIPHHQKNKMNEYNCAVVLVPCLIWPQQTKLDDMFLGKNIVKVFEKVLQNFQKVFGSEQQQDEVFRYSTRKSMKRFQNKIFNLKAEQQDEQQPKLPKQIQVQKPTEYRVGEQQQIQPIRSNQPHHRND